ncbi:MAG: hypothetical protein HRT47_04120 [Candidatus Caenarcaniphilales bacterium]|nr:hypothetical protein [Candidatus Caenarcaniphilales bacterium]
MSISFNTNTSAMFSQRAFYNATKDVSDSTSKLATGIRINKGADDAAGLSISKGFETLLKSTTNSKKNISDGVSMLQTMDAALGSVTEELQRIREITMQARNGTYSEDQLAAMQREVVERVGTIDNIAQNTSFNGVSLLDGASDRVLQVGVEDGDTLTFDFASGAAAGVGIEISVATDETRLGAMSEGVTGGFRLDQLNIGSSSVNSYDDSTNTQNGDLSDIDQMIENVTRMRSTVGGYENALNSRMDYQEGFAIGMSTVHANIFNTDYAAESSELIKSQLRQNSAASLLSQANSQSGIALNLIP